MGTAMKVIKQKAKTLNQQNKAYCKSLEQELNMANCIRHETHEFRELNELECQQVSGAIAFLPAVGLAAAGLALFSASEKVGESLGKAFYKAIH